MTASKFAAVLAAAGLSLATFVPAHAESVSPVEVTGRAPTTMTVKVAGLSDWQVHKVVRGAANRVCRNAVANYELDYFEADWCASRTLDRTLADFRTMKRTGGVQASLVTLTLTAD